jgi:hypothetical protein
MGSVLRSWLGSLVARPAPVPNRSRADLDRSEAGEVLLQLATERLRQGDGCATASHAANFIGVMKPAASRADDVSHTYDNAGPRCDQRAKTTQTGRLPADSSPCRISVRVMAAWGLASFCLETAVFVAIADDFQRSRSRILATGGCSGEELVNNLEVEQASAGSTRNSVASAGVVKQRVGSGALAS